MTTLAPDTLLALAPTTLRPLRSVRYDGRGFDRPLAAFAPRDRDLLRDMYREVKGFYDRWMADRTNPAVADTVNGDHLIDAGRELGQATLAAGLGGWEVEKLLHDIRGGGLLLLAGAAELARISRNSVQIVAACGYAARDHAKIMRSSVTDLDPPGRARDQETRVHTVEGFLAPWRAARRVNGHDIRVEVAAEFTGPVAGCCQEAAVVDRVVYNLVNNAARFAADGRVGLTVLAVSRVMTRWVVSNDLSPDERAWLAGAVGGDTRRLYAGGVTHGGSGTGLAGCADLVAAGCGLETGRAAVERGYLGARVIDGGYYSWFHWPVYPDAGPA